MPSMMHHGLLAVAVVALQVTHCSSMQAQMRREPRRPDAQLELEDRSQTFIPTKPLLSGAEVKLKNRHAGTYLTSCSSCDGVTAQKNGLDGTCPNLLSADKGCMFAADGCVSGTYQIIKHGYALGNPIAHGDLVVLKSLPSNRGDADFYSYVGTCGLSSKANCPDTAAMVRLFKGNSSNPAVLKEMGHELMWVISKEQEGDILLGEFITINKAGSVDAGGAGSGSNLALCSQMSSANALKTCGARNNVYTRQARSSTTEENDFLAQWSVEASSSLACTNDKGAKECWDNFACPANYSRYGDGSACKKGSSRCDLGFCAGKPNGGMPSCSTGPTEGKTSGKCWKSFRCPAGYSRYGDGSACKKGSSRLLRRKGPMAAILGYSRCDLGYCAGRPNGGMTSCSTGPKTGKKTGKCWKSFRCPAGFSRYGDGSTCKKGRSRCDLGYCAGRPNGGMTSCSTGPAKGDKNGKCWKSLRCPAGYARFGDGSSCKKGRSRCDLGYCAKKPNKGMPGCEKGSEDSKDGKDDANGKDDKEGEDEDENEEKKGDQDGKGGKDDANGKDDKEGEDEDENEEKKGDQDGKGGKDEDEEEDDDDDDGDDEKKRFQKLNGHCKHASVGGHTRYGVCKADKNCNEKDKIESLQQCKDKCNTTDDCAAIAWGKPSWRGNVAKYGNVTGNQCVVYTSHMGKGHMGCKDSGKGTATWGLQFYKRVGEKDDSADEDEKKCSKHAAKRIQAMNGHCTHASVGDHIRYGVCKADKNCNEKEKVESLQQCEDKCYTTNDCAAIAWGKPSWRGNVAKYGNVTGHQCVVYTKGCKSSGNGTATWGLQYYKLKKCVKKVPLTVSKVEAEIAKSKPKVDKAGDKKDDEKQKADKKDSEKKDGNKKEGETSDADKKDGDKKDSEKKDGKTTGADKKDGVKKDDEQKEGKTTDADKKDGDKSEKKLD